MNKYFFLSGKIKKDTAFAFTADEGIISHRLIPELVGKNEFPFPMKLKKMIKEKGRWKTSDDIQSLAHLWLDYQPNNLAWNFMSERMTNIIKENLTGKENIYWIKVKIEGINEERYYFIPAFKEKLDVLDEKRTTFVSGTSPAVPRKIKMALAQCH